MSFFTSPTRVYLTAAAMRLVFLGYGAWQDAHSAMKYTDIDYNVFTDAARYVSRGASPYARDTYRYTPLLAWMLLPTTWKGAWWFSFGKVLFSLADILAGALVVKVLVNPSSGSGSSSRTGMSLDRALRYASLWLLNPMVANISTRGSSEALLAVLISALLWAVLNRKITLAGFLLGFGVHFKIYPFIYGLSILWWLDESSPRTKDNSDNRNSDGEKSSSGVIETMSSFFTPDRVHLTLTSLSIFSALNVSMYILYGVPFVQHTYLHHLSRIDHRHNFSPYSTLLYLSAAGGTGTGLGFESLAFVPQLLLSVVAIPLVLAKKNLPGAMMAQTFAFVTFNKVCTSQYFLWYLIFLPFYLPTSSLMKKPRLGISAASLWVLAQALWLHQAYNLEFLGVSTFLPGLFLASLFFFGVNIWILGIVLSDLGGLEYPSVSSSSKAK